jgi:tripartite-type tricarboxylate transporter receptor subunit TctC
MIKHLLIILLMLFSNIANAQSFDKSSPIKVIIPFNPGGGVDIIFRNFQKYSERVGINITPVYKPGANGIIGIRELASAAPTGNTIAIVPSQTTAEAVVKDPNIMFRSISGIGSSYWAVVVNPKSEIKSFADLSLYLTSGKSIAFGSGATGQYNMITQLLGKIKVVTPPIIAPFNGAGPAITSLMGGHIDVIIVPISTVIKHLEAGTLRPIAIVGKVSGYDNLPNLQVLFSDWKEYDVFGFILPNGVNADATSFWNAHIKSYLEDTIVQEEFSREYIKVIKFNPASFDTAVELSKTLVKK